jgi:Tfp pilus assembly protein PilN
VSKLRVLPRAADRREGGVPVIGVDLGMRRIKVVVLGRGEARPELRWSVDVPTPAGVFTADGGFDSVVASRVLAQLLRGGPGGGAASGAVVLPSTTLRLRRLQAASGDQAVLAKALAEDSELRIPGVGAEGLYHATAMLGDTPSPSAGDGVRTFVAAAARRDAIRAYTAAASGAGVRAIRISAPAVALANVHAELHPGERARATLLLHVGASRSDLVVVDHGAPVLALSVVQGMDQLYERVAGASPGTAGGVEGALRGDPGEEVLAAIDEWVNRIRGAHRTAVGAAEQRLRTRLETLPVRVSGGAAEFDVVVSRLVAGLGGEVAVLDPAEGFDGPPEGRAGPASVLAIGCALEAAAAQGPLPAPGAGRVLLNLALPDERRRRIASRKAALGLARDPRVWVAAVLAALAAIVAPGLSGSRLARGEEALAQARAAYRQEAALVAADSARIAALQGDSARLAGTLGRLAALEAERYRWPKLMSAAAASLPPFTWLESLELDAAPTGARPQFRVRGVAPAQAQVSRFERVLGQQPGAAGVVLEGSESLELGPFPLVGFRFSGTVSLAPDQSRPEGAGYHP